MSNFIFGSEIRTRCTTNKYIISLFYRFGFLEYQFGIEFHRYIKNVIICTAVIDNIRIASFNLILNVFGGQYLVPEHFSFIIGT